MRQVFNRLAKAGRKTVMGGVPAVMLAFGAAGIAQADAVAQPAPANDIPQRVLDAHPDGAGYCAPIDGEGGNEATAARVKSLTDTLNQSEMGASLVDFAKHGPAGKLWVCFIDDIKNLGQYRAGYGVMDLPSQKDPGHFAGTSAHEIRHYWQESRGYGIFQNDTIEKKSDVVLTLASEADADAIATQVMWELKEKGISGNWDFQYDHNICSSQNKVCRDDILKAFEAAILADAKAMENGKALADAFAQWYQDKQRRMPYLMMTMFKHNARHMRDVFGVESDEPEDPGYLPETLKSPISKLIRDGEIDGIADLPHKGTNYLNQQGGYLSVMQAARKDLKPYKPKTPKP